MKKKFIYLLPNGASVSSSTFHSLEHLLPSFPRKSQICCSISSPMTSSTSILRRLSLFRQYRHFSSSSAILSGGDANAVLTSKEKSRAALSLLKTEKNPERIIDICRAASLTPESHLDCIAFSVAISKLSESNYFEGIHSFVEELKRRPDLKNERFASHSMVLYGQAGMIQNAIATFEKLEELGLEKSVKSLNSLIFACTVAHEYDEARRVFVDFPKRYGIKRDLHTYNYMIKALSESGSSSSGYSIVADMEKEGCKPDATTFGTLIEGFYREEKLEDVGKVLQMMEDRNMKPGIGIFNIRIKSLCKLRRSNEAKALLDSMLSRRMKVNSLTYNYLIYGFCKEGNLEEAKKLFKSMVNGGYEPDSSCYFTIVYYLCQGGDYETALPYCKQSMSKNWVPSFTTMKTLVEGLASVSKADEARELIEQVKEKFPSKAEQWKEIEDSLST